MSVVEMKVPSPGESITEVQIAKWIKKDGDYVEKDEELCEMKSQPPKPKKKLKRKLKQKQNQNLSLQLKPKKNL